MDDNTNSRTRRRELDSGTRKNTGSREHPGNHRRTTLETNKRDPKRRFNLGSPRTKSNPRQQLPPQQEGYSGYQEDLALLQRLQEEADQTEQERNNQRNREEQERRQLEQEYRRNYEERQEQQRQRAQTTLPVLPQYTTIPSTPVSTPATSPQRHRQNRRSSLPTIVTVGPSQTQPRANL
ncbi:hypothetical protein Glove_213g12 [Diversispora epigaea]|uniref:Uncharacterized protein n=1 Tax=Diversispora epigaea TaxID=1348612 RepID=A0A397IHT7_9GLOM|nr:hypothetical protein Glove_213g12 [Diversispora epigaea]